MASASLSGAWGPVSGRLWASKRGVIARTPLRVGQGPSSTGLEVLGSRPGVLDTPLMFSIKHCNKAHTARPPCSRGH